MKGGERMSQEPYNHNDDLSNEASQMANNTGKKIGNVGKKAGKKIGKFLAKKALKAVAKAGAAVMKAVATALAPLIPYILAFLGIILVIVIGWYVLFEIRGATQTYSYQNDVEENETEYNDSGYRQAKNLSSQNEQIVQFYRYFGQRAYMQIVGDDNEELVFTEGEDAIRDYYKKEREFSINPNFLWALDTYGLKGKWFYPEQWIQPVHYNPDDLTLKSLVDDKGMLKAESTKYKELDVLELREALEKINQVTFSNLKLTAHAEVVKGKPYNATDEKVKGVWDYGFGSIFKYKEDEITKTVEGTITGRDEWNAGCKCVQTKAVNIPFSYTMDGYPEKIHLITRAITFVGETDFKYEKVKTQISGLQDGIGANNSDKNRVIIGTYDEYETVEYEVDVVDPQTGEVTTETRSYERFVQTHTLHEYRSGAVYETKPEEIDRETNDKGKDYAYDYLMNLSAWAPQSVMDKLHFEERVGTVIDVNLELGGATNSEKFLYVYQNYFDVISKYSAIYGVDPYVMVAIMTQESGGKTGHKDGPFQITGNGTRTVKAKNVLTGQYETHAVHNSSDRNNIEISARWAVMYLAGKIERFDGDVLKAIQSYNFDVGIIKDIAPHAYDTDEWMKYREQARAYYGKKHYGTDSRSVSYSCAPDADPGNKSLPVYGDVCYIEHVLQYYAGEQLKNVVSSPNDEMQVVKPGEDQDKKDSFLDKVKSFFGLKKPTYTLEEPRLKFTHQLSHREVDNFFKSVKTFDSKLLFSEIDESHEAKFWEDGYSDSARTTNMSHEEFIELVGQAQFITPLNMKNPPVTSHFGSRWGEMHLGTDVGVPIGTPIYAIADATVEKVDHYSTTTWGKYVRIKIDGTSYRALYAHLNDIYVTPGQSVKQGQLLGVTGNTGRSTGPHLHFEFWTSGSRSNAINPYHIVYQPHLFP